MKKHINLVKRALALGLIVTTFATTPNLTVFAEEFYEEHTTIEQPIIGGTRNGNVQGVAPENETFYGLIYDADKDAFVENVSGYTRSIKRSNIDINNKWFIENFGIGAFNMSADEFAKLIFSKYTYDAESGNYILTYTDSKANGRTLSVSRSTVESTQWFKNSGLRSPAVAERELPNFTVQGDFIPFRDQIPSYLADNSSAKSDIVKKVWCKLFYEELNWKPGYAFYDSKYSSWSDKYGHTETYRTLSGEQSNVSGQITYSTGDFEAYFGNTIEDNPEFLGQLLGITSVSGIEGYDVNGLDLKDEAGKELLKNVVGKYLYDESDPTKYNQFFAESIVNLTKDGLYLDGCLKSVTCNGIRADYAVLSNLASKYRQKDSSDNLILSQKQIEWIESYQLEFYDAYTKGTNAALKGMVIRNENLYDFIARSKYAANDRNGYGQEFFDYVVESGIGAGEWLALNSKINGTEKINGEESSLQTEIKNEKGIDVLKDIDDITALFEGSSGYCGGLDATTHCSGHDHSCYAKKLRLTNGTIDESDDTFVIPAELCENDATQNDMLCVLLNRNSEAVRYIEGNSTTKAAYGDKDTKETWYYRHEAKHKDWSGHDTPVEPGSFKMNVKSARNSCYDPHNNNASESGMKTTYSTLTYTYKISELLKKVPDQVTSVTLKVQYEGHVIDEILHSKKSNPANVCDDSTWSSPYGSVSYSEGINHISTIRDRSKQYYKFDLSGCTSDQLESGWVYIQTCASTSSYNGDGRNYCQCILYEIGYETVMDDCEITQHQWQGIPTYTFDEKGYIVGARIDYECDKNKRNHKDSYNVPKTKIGSQITGSSITYKIIGKHGDIYTKVISTGGSSDPYKAEPILLTNDNTSGSVGQDKSIPSDYGYSDKEVWPSGWGIGYDGHVNSAHYVSASAVIDGSVPAGYIPTGVNQIVFGFSANETLEALSISVYNARGQKIGFGGMNMAGSISGNTCTVKINARSDADLMGATVKFYGKSSSIRWASSHWEKLGGISSSISLNSMTFVY